MKNLFTLIIIALIFNSCSSDDGTPENETPIVENPTANKYYTLDDNTGQCIVYLEKADGSDVKIFDYAFTKHLIPVQSGDKITVTCKVGKEVVPSVKYKVINGNSEGEIKYLVSKENTSSFYGFRLMGIFEGENYILIE